MQGKVSALLIGAVLVTQTLAQPSGGSGHLNTAPESTQQKSKKANDDLYFVPVVPESTLEPMPPETGDSQFKSSVPESTLQAAPPQHNDLNLLIDSSRPYAYLAFDHLSPSKSAQKDTSNGELWLRLVNNSRFALAVQIPGGEYIGAGTPVVYETIANKSAKGSVIGCSDEAETGHSRSKPASLPLHQMRYFTSLGSGQELSFYVPRNSVGPDRFLRVRCALQIGPLNPTKLGPYTELDFFDDQIADALKPLQWFQRQR